jgi:V/A-type H+/Na+-transporting ATPase subunit F
MVNKSDSERDRIAVIGGSVMTLGFRFAGIKRTTTIESNDSGEIVESGLREALADPVIGIIVISTSALQRVKDRKLRQFVENGISPVVISVPDFRDASAADDSLRSLIKRAIGIDIDLIKQNSAR